MPILTPKQKLTKPVKHNCRYTFNQEELLEIGRELAETSQELSELDEDKKRVVSDFAARIAAKESLVSIAARKIQTGYEWRDMACTVHFNEPKTGRKTIIRDDTTEKVAEQDMTPDELQQDLLPAEDK